MAAVICARAASSWCRKHLPCLPGAKACDSGLDPPHRCLALLSLLCRRVQGVLLERLSEDGDARCLAIAIDFEHACLVLQPGGSSLGAATPATGPGDCLRSVNSLDEALAVLHRETGRLGPSLTASPIKQPGSGSVAPGSPAVLQSPAKPPLPASHGVDALRLAVDLVQACSSAKLREGLAILSAAAGSPQASAAAVAFGALEALVTAAATVLPSLSMGLAELQPSLTVAVTSLLDAAPPASYAAGRLASILAAVLQQSCANPLLLCHLLVALLQRADVRTEAMLQGLASPIADMYARLSPEAAAAAGLALEVGSSSGACGGAAAAVPLAGQQQNRLGIRAEGALVPLGFGSPLLAGQADNAAADGSSAGQVSALVATFNAMSDSGSDCSPSASRSSSPIKVGGGPLFRHGGRLGRPGARDRWGQLCWRRRRCAQQTAATSASRALCFHLLHTAGSALALALSCLQWALLCAPPGAAHPRLPHRERGRPHTIHASRAQRHARGRRPQPQPVCQPHPAQRQARHCGASGAG